MSTAESRPAGIDFKAARAVYRREFRHLVGLAFVLYVPFAIGAALTEHFFGNGVIPTLIGAGVFVFGLYWLQSLHALEAAGLVHGETSPEERSALARLRSRFWPFFLGELLIAVAAFLVVLLAAVVVGNNGLLSLTRAGLGGILAVVGFFLFVPVSIALLPTIMAVEDWGPLRSFWRLLRTLEPYKFEGTEGPWALGLVAFGGTLGAYFAVRAILDAVIGWPGWAGSFVSDIVVDPLTAPMVAILWVQLYLDLRVRLEAAAAAQPASAE